MSSELIVEFLKYLARNKMRMTGQRARIIAAVLTYSSPFTAEDIVLTLSRFGSDWRVSRSTLYRMLVLLEDVGLITKESKSDGINTYLPGSALIESVNDRLSILANLVSTEFDPSEFMEVDPSLCDPMHRTMIAGTCPWCGQEIFKLEAKSRWKLR